MKLFDTIKQIFANQFAFFMTAPALIWHALFFVAPLSLIVFISFMTSDPVMHTMHATLHHYQSVLDFIHLKIIICSLIFALLTTLACLFIGYPIAYYLALKTERFRNILLFFLIIPFWSNILILIYAWFFILEKEGLLNKLLLHIGIISQPLSILNSLIAIGLVTFYCYLPFMILPIFSVLEKLDISLVEASLDLGASHWQTFFSVILPLSWSGIKTGFFLVFVISFGELIIPLLMGGDKYLFVGNAISHYVFNALDLAKGAAFTTISAAAVFVSLLVITWFLKRIITR